MAFHPHYWSQAVRNGSSEYNQYAWNLGARKDAATFVKSDPRKIPKPEQSVDVDPQIRLIPQTGGTIMFSGAQMHPTAQNTARRTRFSIDFRTRASG